MIPQGIKKLDTLMAWTQEDEEREKSCKTMREIFTGNSYKAKLQSVVTGASSYVLGATSAYLLCNGGSLLSISATAISSVFMGVLWHKWGNKPKLLADKALDAIVKGDEQTALKYLKQGADIFELYGGKIAYELHLFPLFPIISRQLGDDILTKAAQYGCEKVVGYLLLSKGSELNLNRALGMSNNLKIVQMLVENGALLVPSKSHSPLYLQAITMHMRIRGENVSLAEKLKIIDFLLDQNVKLNREESPEDFISRLKDSIKSYNKSDDPEVNQTLASIEEKIRALVRH